MDYGFFDGLIDSVFVINADRGILYCNEAAAKLCESSVKRLSKGKPIYETLEFSDPALFVMPTGESGRDTAAPYAELEYKLKSGKSGKVQVAIQPFSEPSGDKRWAIMIRDVTIEEVLHGKHLKQLAQLEAYSKNLEQMVEERTLEVKRANIMLNAIMNSLGQGFLVFDKEGVCSDFYTKACEEILEASPAKKKIWDVLKISETEAETFHMWMAAIWGEQLPFDSLKELGPSLYNHSKEKHIKLDYFPLRNSDEKIAQVVMVATDQTSEFLANKALEREKKYAKMVIKLVTGKKQFSQFLESAKSTIGDVKTCILSSVDKLDHEYIFRLLHTLEGEAATYSAVDIWAASRQTQEIIEPVKKGLPFVFSQVKDDLLISIDRLQESFHNFMHLNHELFSLVGIGESDKIEIAISEIEKVVMHLQKRGVSQEICEEVSDALMREPVLRSFRHYQDVASTVAEKLNKKLNPIIFTGEQVRIFSTHYQNLFSTLVHAFRNAVDHGIEPSEEREMVGKPPAGTIRVTAEKFFTADAPWIRLKIQDDGRGIIPDSIRMRLSQTSEFESLKKIPDAEIIQHVFDSGISTKDNVGEFSGRGIGMNAIKAETDFLGGRTWVVSTPGQGTDLFIEVPDFPRVAKKQMAA